MMTMTEVREIQAVTDVELPLAEREVLVMLSHHGESSVAGICHWLQRPKESVLGSLRVLADKGLAEPNVMGYWKAAR
jgi:hypothetical protein